MSKIIINSILFALFLCLIPKAQALQFTVSMIPHQRFCFYEVFEAQQKYTFVSTSSQHLKQQMEVSHIDGRQWKSVFFRQSQDNEMALRADKLASSSTTYSFCVRNTADKVGQFKVQFSAGIDVMELHNLPDATDGDNLQRQLNWLEKQTTILSEKAQNIEGLRRINFQINGMVGTKMIFFAIVGLAAIGIVNFLFYRAVRSQLKKRKLI